MPSACNIRPVRAFVKQGSNPVSVKPKEYNKIECLVNEHATFVRGQEGQFELHAADTVIHRRFATGEHLFLATTVGHRISGARESRRCIGTPSVPI